MGIHLYAEHLVNIRALSIQASLSTVSNTETRATLSAEGSALTLSHEGEVARITLPIRIPGRHSDATLTIPAAPTKDLSFRVSLQDQSGPGEESLLKDGVTEEGDIVPWNAISLPSEVEISCRHCGVVFLDRGKVHSWKDLPSENWAEMMDFWHCHRPHVPSGPAEYGAPQKGYSADSRLALHSGTGMVNPVDFVITPDDCRNLVTSPPSRVEEIKDGADEDLPISCISCSTEIGQVYTSTDGYKLRKSHLALSMTAGQPPKSYAPEKWLACHLLSSISTQGVRKFAITSAGPLTHASSPLPTKTNIEIWVFTPDLTISSSAAPSSEPFRVAKVLWQDATGPADAGMLNRQALFEGSIELPEDEMHCLKETLVNSTVLMPEGARKFQDWNVGLLRRFGKDEVQ